MIQSLLTPPSPDRLRWKGKEKKFQPTHCHGYCYLPMWMQVQLWIRGPQIPQSFLLSSVSAIDCDTSASHPARVLTSQEYGRWRNIFWRPRSSQRMTLRDEVGHVFIFPNMRRQRGLYDY